MSNDTRNTSKLSNMRLPLPNDPIWHDEQIKEINNEWIKETTRLRNYHYKKKTFANLKKMNPELTQWDIELMWSSSLRDLDREYRAKIHNLVKDIRRENNEKEKIKETALKEEKELKAKKRHDTKERKAAEALLMLQNPELYKPRRSSRIAKNQQNAG